MDAFYASIEQRDNPLLQNKPVAVGYAGARGVVASASYEARKFGIRSAMSSQTALKKCPGLIFVASRFDIYKKTSQQIMDIFHEYTDLVEPLSLDEAFLDVTENHKQTRPATWIAKEIKKRIFEETGLTSSAGISFNKFLAKIASDYKKPDGLFVIKPDIAEKFVEQLPIEQFHGIGKVTAERMHRIGVKTGLDLKNKSEDELIHIFGKAGAAYYQYARAIDHREVNPNRIRKSIGAENTFSEDITDIDIAISQLEQIAGDVMERVNKSGFKGRTITLKVKYSDFRIITRSRTLFIPVTDFGTLLDTATGLIKNIKLENGIRLLGLSIKTSDTPQWKDAIQLEIDFNE